MNIPASFSPAIPPLIAASPTTTTTTYSSSIPPSVVYGSTFLQASPTAANLVQTILGEVNTYCQKSSHANTMFCTAFSQGHSAIGGYCSNKDVVSQIPGVCQLFVHDNGRQGSGPSSQTRRNDTDPRRIVRPPMPNGYGGGRGFPPRR